VTFVGNKDPVPIGQEVNELEAVNPFAVRPATRKISRAINPVIKRAGKVEVSCDQFFNGRAVLCHIGFVSRARDRDKNICSGDISLGRFLGSLPGFDCHFVRFFLLVSGVTRQVGCTFRATLTCARLSGASD
jgi:hypothetical protein